MLSGSGVLRPSTTYILILLLFAGITLFVLGMIFGIQEAEIIGAIWMAIWVLARVIVDTTVRTVREMSDQTVMFVQDTEAEFKPTPPPTVANPPTREREVRG